MKLEDRDPFDYFRDDRTPKKKEPPTSEELVNNLRSDLPDLLAASEVEPEEETVLQQFNPKVLAGIFIGIAILAMIIFSLIGPGRAILERRLIGLKNKAATYTQQAIPTIVSATKAALVPSITPTQEPTITPTSTRVVVVVDTPTPNVPTVTPTSESSCRDALTITMEDVGKTLCVQGTIIETVTNPTYFMVIFNTARGSFYWVTYDMVWSEGKVGECYQVTGEIYQMGISPMLVFGFNNKPTLCP
jgi:hypothetical protein